MACDLVVAGVSAKFGVPEVKRSLVAGAGGALLLARRIPRALALEMLLTGDPFDAHRAAEIGLVNRVVDDGQALNVAIELADKSRPTGRWRWPPPRRSLTAAPTGPPTNAGTRWPS